MSVVELCKWVVEGVIETIGVRWITIFIATIDNDQDRPTTEDTIVKVVIEDTKIE